MKSIWFWCFTLFGLSQAIFKLEERYSWNQLDFVFPTRTLKDIALASGSYIPQNALPVGVEHWENKLFVTVPRWKDGIPATLTYIDTAQTISGSPQLIPYPDWRSNAVGDCANGLNTVYRIKADKCGRLWVLDTGTIGIGNTTQNVCPYSVNVFDLASNTRIRRYEFRAEDTNADTFIANTVVDVGKNCEDTFAYFSDELGYGLIVYSWEKNKSWRFDRHSYFFPDPLRGDFNIGGLNFQWGDEGIFGMALSPIRSDGYRILFFSPLASHREFSVSTRILRDESRVDDSYHDFFFFGTERAANSHTTAKVCSDDGILLFNLIDQNAVGCWHTSMPYTPTFHGIVDRDDEGLIFPADVKIDENRDVWVLSDRMSTFLLSNLDYNDVNFRIYSAPLSTLIGGTVCDLSNRVVSSRFGVNSILSSKPLTTGSNLYTNSLGLGGYKSLGSNPDSNISPQSIQSLQQLNSQSLQGPLQPNGQIGQIGPINHLGQIGPISQISPIQQTVAYDVREPLTQSFTSKPLQQLYTTKTTPQNTFFKGSIFGSTSSQSQADFTTAIQHLPKSPSWWTSSLW